MHARGVKLRAVVTALRDNSAELTTFDGEDLILLGPQASESGTKLIREVLKMDQIVEVFVLRYSKSAGVYVVTMRQIEL